MASCEGVYAQLSSSYLLLAKVRLISEITIALGGIAILPLLNVTLALVENYDKIAHDSEIRR